MVKYNLYNYLLSLRTLILSYIRACRKELKSLVDCIRGVLRTESNFSLLFVIINVY